MDLRLLDYFRICGRLQHMTHAAKALGITQSALSRAVARLEAELGVPLFERAGRSVHLTRFGEAFLQRVERGFEEIEAGRQELVDLVGGERGTVAFGFLRTLAAEYVPDLIRRFRDVHPAIQFTIGQGVAATLESQLRQGTFDLILSIVPPTDKMLEWHKIDERSLMLIVPTTHALAGKGTVSLQDVASEPFVAFKRDHAIRLLSDRLCAAAGFVPRVALEAEESSSVRGFVAAGFGVAIVPEGERTTSVVSLRLIDQLARRDIGIAWVAGRYLPQSAQNLRDFLIPSR